MSRSAARLDPAGEMRGVGKARVLRDQRSSNRAIAGTAGEDHTLAVRVGKRRGVELGHRHVDRIGIALDVGLVRLANIDQQDRALGDALGDVLRVQVFHALASERHGGLLTQTCLRCL
jgi:hypothetical protein